MSAPVFLYDPVGTAAKAAPGQSQPAAPQVGDLITLDGPEGRHAATVQRLRVGEELDLVDGFGLRLGAVVDQVHKDRLSCQVRQVRQEPASGQKIVLVQAIAKAGRDEQAVEASVETGVDEVWAWQAERSIAVWHAERQDKARAKWQATVSAAVKQSRRAWLPPVAGPYTSNQLAQQVAQATAQGDAVLVLHETGPMPLAAAQISPQATRILVLVGPEGGISEREVELFTHAGAQTVRLGPHVMRTSTAGPVAIAVLSQQLGRWA